MLGDGGRAVVELLKGIGAVMKVKRIKHRYPYDWKSDKPVIIMYVSIYSSNIIRGTHDHCTYRATSQWFANLDAIKDDAIAALQDVKFYPPQCACILYPLVMRCAPTHATVYSAQSP